MVNFIGDLLNLHKGEESKEKTLELVKSNISFTGSNLWILACAIMVASVGLNVNSTAVIIGAMLISPLMGPIVGAGFALGVYDFILLKRSLRNLLIATVASLIVSTVYFFLSPFKEAQSELLARTAPNIYDVLIAFFGGLVGVIAVTRVEKGNPIPGVAIATALMPPLCTAGYGLATGHWRFFFGALFLYSINCVFICIATFGIVKFLKYPPTHRIDEKNQKRVRYGITALIIAMLAPSAYFAFSLYKQQEFKQLADTFIEQEFVKRGSILVYKKTEYSNRSRNIEVAFLKKNYSDAEIKDINNRLEDYGLHNTTLTIRQDSTDNLQNFRNDIMNEVNKKDRILDEKDIRIRQLETEIAQNTFDNKQLYTEINVLYPSVKAISVSNHTYATAVDSLGFSNTVLIYESKEKLDKESEEKLSDWLAKRLNLKNIELFFKEIESD